MSVSQNPILVVDDEPEIRLFIRTALEGEGLAVEMAADGQQAIERGRERQPALVVLDVTLPDMLGDEVASQVRASHGPALPIVIVTADGHAAQKARRIGAQGFLSKPFDVEDLISCVRQYLPAP